MKFFNPVIVLVFLALTACKGTTNHTISDVGGTVIVCRFADISAKGETPQKIEELLKKRLALFSPDDEANSFVRELMDKDPELKFGSPTVKYNQSDSTFVITLPGFNKIRPETLLAHGRFGIAEIYQVGRMQQPMEEMGFILPINADFYNDVNNFSPPSAYTIYKKDMAVVDSIVKTAGAKVEASLNAKFAWGWVDDEEFNLLYLLKNSNDNIDLNSYFESSNIEPSYNVFQLAIKLNKSGAIRFERLTEKNIHKFLAFTLDDKVLMAPMVSAKIEGGRLSISGRFSADDLITMNALLRCPILNSQAEILSVNIIDPPVGSKK